MKTQDNRRVPEPCFQYQVDGSVQVTAGAPDASLFRLQNTLTVSQSPPTYSGRICRELIYEFESNAS